MQKNSEFDLSNKNILLIGCNGVLGTSYVHYLNGKCKNLILADLSFTNLKDVKNFSATTIHFEHLDLTKEQQIIDLFSKIKKFKKIDGVIFNSAVTGEFLRDLNEGSPFPNFDEYPLKLFNYTLNVNLVGCFLIARECSKIFKLQKFGSLINIASIYSVVAPDHSLYDDEEFNTFPGYAASKWGIVGLTKWTSTLWAEKGIRSNCVSPGGIFNDHTDSFRKKYEIKTPMKRMGNPKDLFGIIHYLLSDSSCYVTGQNFVIDGGFSSW